MSRLFLHQIELRDFKSFRGEFKIGPFSPFSAIIGPNGAGKSNVLDALAFCLLLDPKPRSTNYIYVTPIDQEAKSCFVRVILKRTGKKKEEFVTFEHQLEEIEGEEGKKNYEEHFLVNGEELSKDEYVEEITNNGITPLCFVKQAQIDEVARMTPQELTTLFETYSGSIKYAQKYEDLRIQLESAQQEFSIIEKRRRASQTEKQHITKSQQEAKNYEELTEKLKEMEIEYALFQLYGLKDQFETAKDDKDDLEQQIANEDMEIRKMVSSRKEAQESSNKFKDEISKIDNTIQKSEQTIREYRAKLATEEQRMEFFDRSVIEKQNQIISKTNATEEWQKQINRYKKEVEAIDKELVGLPDPGALRADMSKYNSIRAQSSRLYSDIAQEVEKTKMESEKAHDDLIQIEKDLENANNSLTRTRGTLSDTEAEREKYKTFSAQAKAKKEDVESQLKLITMRDNDDKTQRDKKVSELDTKTRKYDELKRTVGTNKRREKFLKTVNNLKRLVPGVYGLLGELYTPQKESYQKAILAAIGDRMDTLIVRDRQVSQRCLEYFKEQNAGTISTLPIKGLDWKQKKISGNVTPLSKLIKPKSDEYKPAFEYICNSIVVAKGYDEAKKLAFDQGYNAVTVDGTYFDHHGFIQTGISHEVQYNENQLTELSDAITKLSKEVDQLNDDIEHRKPDISDMNDQVETYTMHIKGYQMKLSEIQNKLLQYQSNERTIAKKIKELEKEKETVEKQYNEKQELYHEAQAKQDEIDNKLFEDIKLESGESIKEVEERYNRRTTLERRREFLIDIIPNDEKVDASKAIEELTARLEEDKKSLNESKDKIKSLKEDIKAKDEENKQRKKELIELRGSHEDNERQLIELNRDIRKATESLDQDRSTLSIHEHDYNTARQQISVILQHCVLSNIPLPHTSDFQEKEITSTLSNDSQIQEDVDEIQYIDFSKLTAAQRSTKKGTPQYQIKINNYESEIQKMQQEFSQAKPDFKSTEKFESIEKEIQKMKADSEEADKLVKKTKAEFNNTRETRRKLFMELYDYLDTHINNLYQLFTQRKSKDHGGVAYLAMEDTDEPYLGGIKFTAMPPHKRFRDLDQLSGGEKAIASLALIITLQEYLKAPFVLLDEPDASLDKVNLSTAALALRNESQKEEAGEDDEDSHGLQVICVSLRDKYFSTADVLVGVYKELETQSSGVVSLSLQQYKEVSLRMEEI